MPGRDIIVVGASLGGVETLRRLAAGLPADLAAGVCVVCHVRADADSHRAEVLARSGPLRAATARDGEPIRPGCIYVAPPDRHLVLLPGAVCLTHGPRENGARP